MAEAADAKRSPDGDSADGSGSKVSDYWNKFKTGATNTGSWMKEKSKSAAASISEGAKKLDDKTGFTSSMSHAGTKMGEGMKKVEEKTGIGRKTSTLVKSAKDGILGGVGAARKSMRLWPNDLRFFDDNRLDTFKLFERFDKDKDGRLNDEEFTTLLNLMFQWFHTQQEVDQHYIPPKGKFEADVQSAKEKAKAAWGIPDEGVDKALLVSNWISFFSEQESFHVTFRGHLENEKEEFPEEGVKSGKQDAALPRED